MQVFLLDNKISVNLRDAENKAEFLSGSMLALCNHPTAKELSPKLKKHSSAMILSCKIACHIVITDARNLRQLFRFLTASWNFGGICNLQAYH
jgi:hypothetical protein